MDKKIASQPQAGEGIEEVFVVKTCAIDFFAAIVSKPEGVLAVEGRILFKDGGHQYFSKGSQCRVTLRNEIIGLCESIARFYSTKVFRYKFSEKISYEDFLDTLRSSQGVLN